jgi:hypothetical protein
MQNETTKTISQSKKYGEPYSDKDKLRRGDIKLIANATGFAYISVVQQLSGIRSIAAPVKAMADKLVENNQALIKAIEKINVNQ